MAEKAKPDESMIKKEPEVVINASACISASFHDKDGREHESFYPEEWPSKEIALSTAADLSIEKAGPTFQEKVIETIETVQKSGLEGEVDLAPFNIPLGKLKFKLVGKKITKIYRSKQTDNG